MNNTNNHRKYQFVYFNRSQRLLRDVLQQYVRSRQVDVFMRQDIDAVRANMRETRRIRDRQTF